MSLIRKKRLETKKKLKYTIDPSVLPTLDYGEVYKDSIENPESFWAKVGTLVTWAKPWKKVLDNSREPFTKWFVGGEISACYNAVDRHVEAGKGSKAALIYDSPLTGVSRRVTYSELLEKVSRLSGLLARYGVEKGDRVLIYMPLIPETVTAMLAVTRLGAIHSVVFGGFAATELSTRIDHAEPKVIIAASCGIEPNKIVDYIGELNHAIAISAHKPKKCVIYQRKGIYIGDLDPKRDIDWEEGIKSSESVPCVPVEANDPLYILYTSGTTGEPKGVQRPTGGYMAQLVFNLQTLYGLSSDDVWWATSDFGWVVGHSYMAYGPLAYGMTSVIYEGKPTTTPDPSSYYRIINEYKVNGMFTVPTALRILREVDPEGKFGAEYDLSSLKQIWVAGEHLDMSTKLWAENIFGVPVTNHWWQTETGSAISGTCAGLINPCCDVKLTTGLPFPGYNVQILRKNGSLADANELGRIGVKLPLPPGVLSTLYKANDRFYGTYFTSYPGYYDTMDVGHFDEDGLLYVTARADDVINVAGHRLSTLALEDIVLSHPDICNACVVSVPDNIKSEVPLCLFVMKEDAILNEYMIAQELVAMVREHMGPVASFRLAARVKALPTTRSGKISRKSISELARNKMKKSNHSDIKMLKQLNSRCKELVASLIHYFELECENNGPLLPVTVIREIPASILDPTVYKEIEEVLRRFGFCK